MRSPNYSVNDCWRNAVARPLRTAARASWLCWELARAAVSLALDQAPLAGTPRHESPSGPQRRRWFGESCRRLLRVFNISLEQHGQLPNRGILVCNHLSYLDVLVLGALASPVFVAKIEVRGWPVFGWFARAVGTIFVDRSQRLDVGAANQRITAALEEGALVAIFPEGTTSNGQAILPFRSALLDPAAKGNVELSAGLLEYAIDEGNVAEEICYWRDMTLVPHLLNLLGKGRITARIQFKSVEPASRDRKALARQLHAELSQLKNASDLYNSCKASPVRATQHQRTRFKIAIQWQ